MEGNDSGITRIMAAIIRRAFAAKNRKKLGLGNPGYTARGDSLPK